MEKILRSLGLSENSQKVYLALVQDGRMPARQLSQKTGLPKATTYDALSPLVNMGIIFSREEDGRMIYGIGDPNAISLLLDEKISSLQKTKKEAQDVIEKLSTKASAAEPQIRFFSGKEGVRKIFNDVLWYENIETYTLWPMSEMLVLLGSEYLEWHNEKRVTRKIRLKSLRLDDDGVDLSKHDYLDSNPKSLRELRRIPKRFSSEMSYWIYADKTAFVSTGPTPFGFIVHSKEFASMMMINFDLLWDMSKEKPRKK